MRIGIDARELCGHATGVGRYLAGLLAQWSAGEGARRHEFVLYAPDDIGLTLDARRFATRRVPAAGATLWEQMRLPAVAARDRLDVFFAPGYTAPLRLAAPLVLAIHDVSFSAHPEWFRLAEGARRRFFCRRSAHRARAVITISNFSMREIVDRLGVAKEKVHVIPPGVTPLGCDREPRDLSILFVGSIFNRRHLPDLIRAFAPIARGHPAAQLDIVGDNRSHPHEDIMAIAAAAGVGGQMHWHRYVTDEALRALYRRARAFVFLSEYEGLGLTPLEALGAGVPPVLLDTPVARETCGDCALYVPLGDRTATTRAIETVLFDERARERLLAGAAAVLARYDWTRAARETLALLESSVT